METINGANNLLLTCRREANGVELLRVETADTEVVLPETLWGLPVTALGDHAFSPGQREVDGEQIRIVCGPPVDIVPANEQIAAITLPDTLLRVNHYAFFNCTGLQRLSVAGTTRIWGGSVLMNCRLLNTLTLRLDSEGAEPLYYFADILSGELDVTLYYPDGEKVRLIFPDYWEDYEENTPAKHFDYHIYGVGYPYHHCFQEHIFRLPAYDLLWDHMIYMEHDPFCAMRLAYWRLRFPRELTDSARASYLRYLRARTAMLLQWLLNERDTRGLAWFLTFAEPDRETLQQACAQARQLNAAEALALLLEEQHRRFPAGAEKTFDL